jgi:sugar phosphate permease
MVYREKLKSFIYAFIMRAYIMWLCAASFYFFQFILRVSPCVLADDIMQAYHLSAAQFAGLGSLALYAYAAMQIPAGILTDIFKPKRMILASLVLCVLGTLLIANTSHIAFAYASRVCVGAGSASGLICCGKVASTWFPAKQQPLIFGLTLTVGTIGALNGGPPLHALSTLLGWEHALNTLCILGAFIGVFIALVMKDAPNEKRQNTEGEVISSSNPTLNDFTSLLKSKNVVRFTLIALGLYVVICVLADLWAVKYLMSAFDMSRSDAAKLASLIYIGMCAGSLVLSSLSHFISIVSILRIALVVLLLGSSMLFYASNMTPLAAGVILFFLGFCAGGEMLCFAAATQGELPRLTATVVGVVNCLVMSTGAFFQQVVGYLLDSQWDGIVDTLGYRVYQPSHFSYALTPLLIVMVFSLWATFLRKN